MKPMVMFCVLTLLLAATSGMASDRDNDGIPGNEPVIQSDVFPGVPDTDALVMFPTAADVFEVTYYPYWWNMGDTVYGVHNPDLPSASHADVALKISYNVLSGGGHVDLDLRINGTTVGSFVVTEDDGTGYVMASFDFDPISPPFEVRYYETNTVAPGAGSISMDESGASFVAFCGPVAAESSTWTQVKRLFN